MKREDEMLLAAASETRGRVAQSPPLQGRSVDGKFRAGRRFTHTKLAAALARIGFISGKEIA